MKEVFLQTPGREASYNGSGETLPPDIFISLEKMGFSFFAGYAIGFMLRFVSRIATFFAGFLLFSMFILQYNGIVVIDWGSMNDQFSILAGSLSSEGSTFTKYMSSNLQNVAAFFGGMALGFRR